MRFELFVSYQFVPVAIHRVACSAGSSFKAQFACESAILKLPKERRRWGESKGAGRGRGERRENAVFFFSPPPPPFPSFALAPTVTVTISTLPNLPLS